MNLKIDKLMDKLNISKGGTIFSSILGITLFVLSIYILKIGIEKYDIVINGDNLTYIFGGLALSGLILIITPMYFGIKNRELNKKVEIEIEKEEIKKVKILEKIKKIIKKKELDKYFNKFLTKETDLGYKSISVDKLGENIRINITLLEEDDDFGRLSLYINSKDYEKLDKIIKDKFKKEEGDQWPKYSYPYIEKFDGNYETLENQLLDIVEIFKK